MWRWSFLIARPFGIALGLFLLLNLFLALKSDRLAATSIWLDLPLAEPWLSLLASLLGISLLAPHSAGERTGLRRIQAGVVFAFLLLAGANALGFYHRLRSDELRSHAPFPFSLVVALVLVLELGRLAWWAPLGLKLPRAARVFFGSLLVVAASFVLVLAHVYTYGMTDHSNAVAQADAVVILGAKAYPNGRLSDALRYRMDKAIELYRQGKARYLIHSGGVHEDGMSEPRLMRRYAIEHGVRPEHNLLDEGGKNTYLSALGCARLARERGFERYFVVSQYFHIARAKMSFEREGAPVYTVPAIGEGLDNRGRLRSEAWSLLREALAYPFYLLLR